MILPRAGAMKALRGSSAEASGIVQCCENKIQQQNPLKTVRIGALKRAHRASAWRQSDQD